MTEPRDVTVDVVVPTYRRPADLERCLSAIAARTRPASQVVVVAHEDGVASHEVVGAAAKHHGCLRPATMTEPRVTASMTAGCSTGSAGTPTGRLASEQLAMYEERRRRLQPEGKLT